MEVLAKRKSIAKILEDADTPEALREQLEQVVELRRFAVAELGLPEGRSYSLYADLGRSAPLWSVVAVPACSMQPRTWCYPLVGCLSYRGYFRQSRARREARRLADRGMDVGLFAVSGYSTLGWFADPLLASQLELGEAELAELIFHELAHERLYIADDTSFNESFASFVGRLGARRWLEARGADEVLSQWQARQAMSRAVDEVLLQAREDLTVGLDAAPDEIACRLVRERGYERLRTELVGLAEQGNGLAEAWAGRALNNAHLALTATYEAGVAAFQTLFEQECNHDLTCFYQRADELAQAERARRTEFLRGSH